MALITCTSFSSTDLLLLPAVACMKCLFCVLVPAEKHGDFLQLVHKHDCGKAFRLQFMSFHFVVCHSFSGISVQAVHQKLSLTDEC